MAKYYYQLIYKEI